ncbi:MAG: DNA polymerase III subunit delta [Clostridia bacterium]|nr:DNA polymerase III subunit delta [Clostridia bacterium]MBP5273234.1 DNA polymerase III subunit delta [Clostridia bacterium]MBP5459143.1 DNA polymerase III subunit delta [Clostridia bacterium]
MKFNEKGLWQNIQAQEFLPVYLIKGSEPYLKQNYARLLADNVVPAGLDVFNFHKLDGETVTMNELVESVEALPAMCERTCVLVHDLDFEKLADPDREELIALLEDAPDTCTLIFWQDTVGFPMKTKKMKDLQGLIDSVGAVVELEARSRQDLVRFVVSECKKQEKIISTRTADYLLENVGEDMGNLVTEVGKLCSYADKEITEADVDAVCIRSLEATAFQMVDALLDNKFDRVFRSLGILFDMKTEPMMILGALVSTYSDMYRAKVVSAEGGRQGDLKKMFPQSYKSDFKLKNAFRRAGRFTMPALRRSLELLADADTRLKSTSEDHRTVFEKLMIELALARREKA